MRLCAACFVQNCRGGVLRVVLPPPPHLSYVHPHDEWNTAVMAPVSSHAPNNPRSLSEAQVLLRSALSSLVFPDSFQLPLDPRVFVTSIVADECRIMDSKMRPLLLVFKPGKPGAPLVRVLFKKGDDLRQDQLTLQVLSVMEQLWLAKGLNLGMLPYRVMSTGRRVGLIQSCQIAKRCDCVKRRVVVVVVVVVVGVPQQQCTPPPF